MPYKGSEKQKEYYKKYYLKNKIQLNKQHKEYQEANSERIWTEDNLRKGNR